MRRATIRGFVWLMAAGLFSATLMGACKSSNRYASTGDDGDGGSSSGGTTGSGNTCKAGGDACVAFDECCSGECNGGVCAGCSSEGESCESGCCQGLTCAEGVCGSCSADGSPCSEFSQCCSQSCNQGVCGPPSCQEDGFSCQTPSDCCSGTCFDGVCGDSNCDPNYTCAEALTGDPALLCEGPAAQRYDDLIFCTCEGPCSEVCGDNLCTGGAPMGACINCLQDTSFCGDEFNDCANN